MLTTATINVQELMQVADAVSKERSVDKSVVMEAMEEVIAKTAKARYGADYDIRVSIDRKTGNINIRRYLEVVDEVEIPGHQIEISEAKDKKAETYVGDFLIDELPPVEIGRISAQSARQVITQKIREAERDTQFNEFKDRVGDIIHGTVRRVEFGNIVIDLGASEGFMRRNECIPRENFNPGDRIRCYIYDVRRENSGPQIFLSRTHPQFLAKLFACEVPEIYDGLIEVKSVVRDPGSKAKMAVWTSDPTLDPVGSCIGNKGVRIQAVTGELQGERIDVFEWSPDIAKMIINVFHPTPVSRVVVNEIRNKVEVVVPDGSLSKVIGSRGQNVRLAAQAIGWDIDVRTEQEDAEKRQKDLIERTELFMNALNVDQLLAQLLASERFETVEDVAETPLEIFASLEGLDEAIAQELQNRAVEYLDRLKSEKLATTGFSDELSEYPQMNVNLALALADAGVKSVEDMAGLAVDEIIGSDEDGVGILEKFPEVTPELAEQWIMTARKQIGWV